MKIRVCPLCDQEMKKAHYCDTCKSFIWKPDYLDIHYNSNTRGRGEENCAYPTNADLANHASGKIDAENFPNLFSDKKREGREPHKTVNPAVKVIAAIVTVLSILLVMWPVIRRSELWTEKVGPAVEEIFGSAKDEFEGGAAYKATESADEAGDTDNRELSHEEVMAGGSACSGYLHMDLTADEAKEGLQNHLKAKGIEDLENNGIYEDNFIYKFESGDRSYFSISETLHSETHDLEIGIRYDTYSQQLHEIDLNTPDEQTARNTIAAILNVVYDNYEMTEDELDACFNLNEDQYIFYEIGDYEIYVTLTAYTEERRFYCCVNMMN